MIDFFKYNTNQKPEKGSFLISEPYLGDPNFERTVILLCEHNAEGSFGFVINRPANILFNEIMEDSGGFDAPVYVGGPVQQDTLHFLHRDPEMQDGIEILKDAFWGGNFEELMIWINTRKLPVQDYRFFVGYSGWGPGQLQDELDADSWIVANLDDPSLVFDVAAEELWKTILKRLGGKYNMVSNYPSDPRLN